LPRWPWDSFSGAWDEATDVFGRLDTLKDRLIVSTPCGRTDYAMVVRSHICRGSADLRGRIFDAAKEMGLRHDVDDVQLAMIEMMTAALNIKPVSPTICERSGPSNLMSHLSC
jgi:hypothetical protein